MKKQGCVEMEKNKNLEYYLDSRIYSSKEVQKSIEETKKEFPNKEIDVSISLNEFGMYIITFRFENKNTYFNKIKVKLWKKFREKTGSDKKENHTQKSYGNYKTTKTYRPY